MKKIFTTLVVLCCIALATTIRAQSCSTSGIQIGNTGYPDPLGTPYIVNGELTNTLTASCPASAAAQAFTRKKTLGAPWIAVPLSAITSAWSVNQTAGQTATTPTTFNDAAITALTGTSSNNLYEFKFVYASASCESSPSTMKLLPNYGPLQSPAVITLHYNKGLLHTTITKAKFEDIESVALEISTDGVTFTHSADLQVIPTQTLQIHKNGYYRVVVQENSVSVPSPQIKVHEDVYDLFVYNEGNTVKVTHPNGFIPDGVENFTIYNAYGTIVAKTTETSVSLQNPGFYTAVVEKGGMKVVQKISIQ
jgi:hypothetical protein